MKTLVYRNAANTTRVEVQVDIFATLEEMQVAGFETRFTNMHISDTPAAIAMGINVEEIENGFGAAKQVASDISGIGLFVIDNNSPGTTEVELVAI